MQIQKISSEAEIEAAFPVIKELRPHLTFQNYTALITEAAKRDDYELVGVFEGTTCLAAMGFRILYDFVHGKHLYIDDLVVTETLRSKGMGAQLLKYAEQVAREKNCEGLRLCTGIENESGKRFYDREGWTLRAVAYKKKLA